MRTQLLTEHAGLRTFALVFDAGDDVMPLLLEAARELGLTAAAFTGIGAFRETTLGYFELERRDYLRIPIREQVELLSLVGNVALADGEPKIHAHVVVGRRDGTALGGHLLDARVRPTLEVVLVETPATLRRTIDKTTGLPLLTR
jgi:predicted DNA-binding protein with PD1-like motif